MPTNNNGSTYAGAGYLFACGLGAQLTAATAITVTDGVHVVTGSAAIATINGGQRTPNVLYLLKASGSTWTLAAGGNISGVIPVTPPIDSVITLVWDGSTSWRIASISTAPTVINVRSYGARGGYDSTAAFLAAWAAAATLGAFHAVAIYIPGDAAPYNITQGLPAFVGQAIPVYGDGTLASVIYFDPATPGQTLMTWQPDPSQATLDFLQVRGFAIAGNITVQKRGILSIGTSYGSRFTDIRIQLLAAGDIAHEMRGWDTTTFDNYFYEASYPIVVDKVSAGAVIGSPFFDHMAFRDGYLYSPDNSHPHITVKTGVNLTNLFIGGRQAFVAGAGGMVMAPGGGTISNMVVENVRWESGVTGYFMDLQPTTGFDITFRNCSGLGATTNGYKFRNTQRIHFDNTGFGNDHIGEVALDIDNSCDRITFHNASFVNGANSQRIFGNALVWQDAHGLVNTAGTPGYNDGYLAKTTGLGIAYEPHRFGGVQCWKKSAAVAQAGSMALPAPTAGTDSYILTFTADGVGVKEAGIFSISVSANALSIGTPSANIVLGAPGAGKIGVFWDGATAEIRNNTGVTIQIVANTN